MTTFAFCVNSRADVNLAFLDSGGPVNLFAYNSVVLGSLMDAKLLTACAAGVNVTARAGSDAGGSDVDGASPSGASVRIPSEVEETEKVGLSVDVSRIASSSGSSDSSMLAR